VNTLLDIEIRRYMDTGAYRRNDVVCIGTFGPGNIMIGKLILKLDGVIDVIWVTPGRRREGIATLMYRFAQNSFDIPEVKHSPYRTSIGDLWANAVGGYVPPRIPPG